MHKAWNYRSSSKVPNTDRMQPYASTYMDFQKDFKFPSPKGEGFLKGTQVREIRGKVLCGQIRGLKNGNGKNKGTQSLPAVSRSHHEVPQPSVLRPELCDTHLRSGRSLSSGLRTLLMEQLSG